MMTQIVGYLYMAVLAGLTIYAVHILILIALYLWHRREPQPPTPHLEPDHYPHVTVQIPLRNERRVAVRILEAVAALDWPRDRLEIQVLDDSDDGTTALARATAACLREQGHTIHVLHRSQPIGNKAGALAAGLAECRSDYIAIFDADFCPAPDFLQRTIPHLVAEPQLGMVQARWGHLNAEYSPITRAQALALDAHFTVEHLARNRAGLLLNFNGTAGVWRRTAIESAGGWQADTLTEDLDLSYRAQLAGWQIRYLPDVVAPAELPPFTTAFKQQQYRWAKGAAQTLRKLAGPLIRSQRLTWYQKLMALLHLSGYFSQPLLLAMLLLTLPMIRYNPHLPQLVAAMGAVTMIPPLLYVLGQLALYRDWWQRSLYYPVLMLLGIGLVWNTTLALWDGLRHWGGDFNRTPKFHLRGRRGPHKRPTYAPPRDRAFLGDLCLGIYALVAVYYAAQLQQAALLPFILIYVAGELLMISGTLYLHRAAKSPEKITRT